MCEKNTTHVRSVSPQIDPKPSPVALPSQTRLRVIAAWLAGGHGAMLTVNNGKEMPGQAPLDTVKLCMFGPRMGQPNSTLICRRLERLSRINGGRFLLVPFTLPAILGNELHNTV